MNRQSFIRATEEQLKKRKRVTFDFEDGLVDIVCSNGAKVSLPIGDFDTYIERETMQAALKSRYPDGVPSNISDFWMTKRGV